MPAKQGQTKSHFTEGKACLISRGRPGRGAKHKRPHIKHPRSRNPSVCALQYGMHPWEGRTVPSKSMFEQEAPKIGTRKCSTKWGGREPLNVEFALNDKELVTTEVFEKRVFEQMPGVAPANQTKKRAKTKSS